MGWDIALVDPATEEPARVVRHQEGSVVLAGGDDRAELKVTYNYRLHYNFRWLDGHTGAVTVISLWRAVKRLGTERAENYWEPTEGNAGWAAYVLLQWAIAHPLCRWRVT